LGKVYYSPFSAYQFIVRPRRDIFTGGVKTDEIRELVAEFAIHGGEYEYENPDGFTDRAAIINGHYFDLDTQAEQKGWTDEEKALVEKRLDRACVDFPREIRLHTKPPAEKPWPTYDDTHHLQVARIAEATGTLDQALAYEKENANRKGVVKMLEQAVAEAAQAAPEPDPEPEDLIPAA